MSEFKVPQRVVIVTMGDMHGIVVSQHTEPTTETNFYHVAFERFGVWTIDVFPEMALKAAERNGITGWFRRKFSAKQEKPSEVSRAMPDALPADVKRAPQR